MYEILQHIRAMEGLAHQVIRAMEGCVGNIPAHVIRAMERCVGNIPADVSAMEEYVRNIPPHQGYGGMCRKYSCTCVCECYGEVCKNAPALMHNKHSCT